MKKEILNRAWLPLQNKFTLPQVTHADVRTPAHRWHCTVLQRYSRVQYMCTYTVTYSGILVDSRCVHIRYVQRYSRVQYMCIYTVTYSGILVYSTCVHIQLHTAVFSCTVDVYIYCYVQRYSYVQYKCTNAVAYIGFLVYSIVHILLRTAVF